MSMRWVYCRRFSSLGLMPLGQRTTMPAMLPPPWDIWMHQVAGVEPATAQATE